MGEYLRNQYMYKTNKYGVHKWDITPKPMEPKTIKFYFERKNKMEKIKKILTEIVKVGGWIIVALQELIKLI